MENIEQQAIQSYQNNMAYFAASHPELHKKMQVLEAAMEGGQFPQKYDLQYQNGYFDVIALASGDFLYGQSSLEHAKKMAKSVNYKKNDHSFEAFAHFAYTKEDAEAYDAMDICEERHTGTAALQYYVTDNGVDSASMKRIHKFIFFGMGLGLHLREIDKKINAACYLIIEDDLEMFRLSLFVTDYSKIAQQSLLIFSVSDNPEAFNLALEKLLNQAFIHNNYIKYTATFGDYTQRIKQIQSYLLSQSHISYPFNLQLAKNIKVLNNLHQHYKVLNYTKPAGTSPFADKPLLFIAAGPSLQNDLKWIEANQERFIIVAVLMVVNTLYSAGIRADVIMHIDEGSKALEHAFASFPPQDYFKESFFIFTASAPQILLEHFDQESIYLIEDLTHYSTPGDLNIRSVGEAGYALLLHLGATELYLAGLDLALDPETGKTHTEDHAYKTPDYDPSQKQEKNLQATQQLDKVASLRETLLQVKGNFLNVVPTNILFNMSINQMNEISRTLKQPHQHVYNLSNGAFFNHTTPLRTSDIDLSSMPVLTQEECRSTVKEYVTLNIANPLSETAIASYMNDIAAVRKALQTYEEQNFSTADAYLQGYIKLLSDLALQPLYNSYDLKMIFIYYIQTVSPLITDLLNTKELSNPKRHIKKIDKILLRQLHKIIDKYDNAIRQFI